MVIVVFGLPGSGKSFFASRLAQETGASYFGTDQIRNERIGAKDYSDSGRQDVYEQLIETGKSEYSKGKSVILDGTFYRESLRKLVKKAFMNEEICFIEVTAPEGIIKKRTEVKRVDSDADYGIYRKIKNDFEPLQSPHLRVVSADENIESMIREALDFLQQTH